MSSLPSRLAPLLWALLLASPLACAGPLRTVTPAEELVTVPAPGLVEAPAEAPAPEPAPAPPPPPPPLKIVAVGDVQLGRAWPEEKAALPPGGAAWLLSEVKPFLADADVTFGNLETVLADGGESKKCGKRSTMCYAFRAPAAYAHELATIGFDVMSIANNHTGDFGPEGRAATAAALDAAGLRHSGPVGDVASFEAKGRKVAMIAFSYGSDVHRIQELEEAAKLVAMAKESHDLVIVSFHAGAEGSKADRVPEGKEIFLGEDRGDSRAFARGVVDAGADLVLGHGPHVLRGMELYRDRLIAYSLGNFSAWESFNLSGPLGITGILEVTLDADGAAQAIDVRPVQIHRPGQPRPDPERKAIELLRRLSETDFGAPLLDEQGSWRRAPATAEAPPRS